MHKGSGGGIRAKCSCGDPQRPARKAFFLFTFTINPGAGGAWKWGALGTSLPLYGALVHGASFLCREICDQVHGAQNPLSEGFL